MAICMNKKHVPTLQAHNPLIGRMMTDGKPAAHLSLERSMRRNPFKDSILSEYSFGIGVVPRRIVLTRSEALATIRGDWLQKV